MAKGTSIEQLNDAVEAIMANRDAPLPAVSPSLAGILRVAGDLRGLPSDAFKARLKAELLSKARGPVPASYGKALMTMGDIQARLQEIAEGPRIVAYDVDTAFRDLPELNMRFLASLNQCTVGVSRFSTSSHWERHPAGDELLYFVEGDADVITLTDGGRVQSKASQGSIFICPQGLWHRIVPRSPVSLFFATPGEGIEHSAAKDPRSQSGGRSASKHKAAKPTLVAHDLGAELSTVPELVITSETTEEEANASFRTVSRMNQLTLGVTRFTGLTPWERHPGGDELLYALDGAVDLTVLTDDGPVQTTIEAGSVFVCPQGLWHRQRSRPTVSILYGTATETTQISFADDPRVAG